MSDEPRHVALERQLAAEGWERIPEDDTAPGSPLAPERAWEHEHPDIWVSVPIDPEHEWYDANCDEVLVAMARARGETWASTLREVERLRAIHETATAWSDDSLRADARRAITVGRAVTLETQTLEEMTVDLVAEVERLRGELAEATKSAAMACELSCGDCAGCRFADDVMRELPATTHKEPVRYAEVLRERDEARAQLKRTEKHLDDAVLALHRQTAEAERLRSLTAEQAVTIAGLDRLVWMTVPAGSVGAMGDVFDAAIARHRARQDGGES